MKKIFFVFSFLFFMFNLFSQEYFDKYIKIDKIENAPIITISDLASFLDIAKSNNIKTAYNNKNNFLYIRASDMYFCFEIKGYKTIKDLIHSNELGFTASADYYKAVEIDILQPNIFEYYQRNHFKNKKDCIDAYNSGYTFDRIPIVMYPFKIQYSFYKEIENMVPKDFYSKIDENYLQLSNPGNFITKNYNLYFMNESYIYYLSRQYGFNNYSQYLNNTKYGEMGYNGEKDYNTSMQNKFPNSQIFYDAQKNGFSSIEEYNEAKNLNINSYNDYTIANSLLNIINKIKIEKKTSFSNACCLYIISSLEKGIEYKVNTIIPMFKKSFNNSKDIERLFTRNGFVFSDDTIRRFLLSEKNESYIGYNEPPRVYWRPYYLRGYGHGKSKQVSTRGQRQGYSACSGSGEGASDAVGGYPIHRGEDRLFA